MKVCFAGTESTMYQPLLLKNGVKNGLECYYYLKGKDPAKGLDFYLLDSGGYVARKQHVVIDVKEYANYLNKHKIKLAFNLDTNDVDETIKNQNYLRAACPDTVIIPVYHMSDWIANNGLLDQFIEEGYQYIALGGTAGVTNSKTALASFYNYCFSKTKDTIKVHGLGQTTRSMLERYPFYSVDSTSWLSMSRFGNSLIKDKQMVLMKSKSRHYMENTTEEIGHWLAFEKELTDLWKRRKVVWTDDFAYRNT